MTMSQGEWITHCDKCRGPVRVSITPQERASMPTYCERCFESLPEGQEDIAPPMREHFDLPNARPPPAAPPAPTAGLSGPAGNGAAVTLDEARRIVREAEAKAARGEPVFVACDTCGGTGRVPFGQSSGPGVG